MRNFLYIFFILFFTSGVAQDSPGVYTVQNVKINTSESDFGTAFLGDNKVVFAAPKTGFTMNREAYKGQAFLDLHVAEVSEDGKLIKKEKLPGDVNTKYHEGMVTFSKDMKTVYFSANGKIKRTKRKKDKDKEVKTKGTANIHLFKANIDENGAWGNLEMLPFNDDSYSTGHPVLNRDDTKLYFVSDAPESLGETDIYVVDIFEDGTYGEPINLGPKINTIKREMFPFIGKDNVLYFSSDGYIGYGELDVYASKIFDNTVSEPINLGEPVNSNKDDFAYIIDDHKHKGYFSSNREGGKGDDDIYSFTASPPIYIECQQEIQGVVRNINTQELIPNVTIVLFDQAGEKLQSFISNEAEGAFSFSQTCNTTYKIQGFLEGYLVGEMDIQTVNDLNADPIEIVFNLQVDPNYQIPEIVASNESDDTMDTASNKVEDTQQIKDVITDASEGGQEVAAVGISNSAASSKNTTSELSHNQNLESNNNTERNGATTDAVIAAAVASEPASVSKENPESVKENGENGPAEGAVLAGTVSSEGLSSSANEDIELETDTTKKVDTEDADVAATISSEATPSTSTNEITKNGKSNTDNDTSGISASKVTANSAPKSQEIGTPDSDSESNATSIAANDVIKDQHKESNASEVNRNQSVEGDKVVANGDQAIENQSLAETSELQVNPTPYDENQGISNNLDDVGNDATNSSDTELTEAKINTIYFDFDKDVIRYDAKQELDKLVRIMLEHPDMKLEINAHTDIRGKKEYNKGLSRKRAYSTSQYLVQRGVDSLRIAANWFGELKPVEKCLNKKPCSDLQHQLNRRSEFAILDKSSNEVVVSSQNRKNTLSQLENSFTSNSGQYVNYNFYEDKEVYTVQIGAFKGKVQTDKFSQLTTLFNHRYDDGLNRFYSGVFENSEKARSHMRIMRKNGYQGAFVVGLKGEDRL